jgi:hypothetical protein
MPLRLKFSGVIYELIETENGTHINIYHDGLWKEKIFVSKSEYRPSDSVAESLG